MTPIRCTMVGAFFLAVSAASTFAQEQRGNGKAAGEHRAEMAAAVKFAETILEHGRDTYGEKKTPLLVDGLNVDTMKPPARLPSWSGGEGMQPWVSSNLADQGNLMRFLVGLSDLTGDPKYKQAAIGAVKYNFDHFQGPSGMLPMGHHRFIELERDAYHGDIGKGGCPHELKGNFLDYHLFWEIDPAATRQLVEGIWNAHVRNWSNLEFSRHAGFGGELPDDVWDRIFDEQNRAGIKPGGQLSFYDTAVDMILAAGMLHKLSGDEKPLVWAERLLGRYIYSAHPITGLIPYQHTQRGDRPGQQRFPANATEPTMLIAYSNANIRPPDVMFAYGATAIMRLGETLGERGTFFRQSVHDYLTAYADNAYDAKANTFRPLLCDGTDLTGYVIQQDGYFGPKGTALTPWKAHPGYLLAFSLCYRQSKDPEMWRMVRALARGNGLGDVGADAKAEPKLNLQTDLDDPEAIFALIELFRATENRAYLDLAHAIAGNMLQKRFVRGKGLFVLDENHLIANLDSTEPLALITLAAADRGQLDKVPTYDGGGHYAWGRTSVLSGHSVPIPGTIHFEVLRPEPGTIGRWLDKSGLDNHAIREPGCGDPAFVDDVFHGKPATRFGGNDWLTIPHPDGLNAEELTIFVVLKWHTTSNAQYPVPLGKLPMNRSFQFSIDDADKAFFTASIDGEYIATPHVHVPSTDRPEIWTARFDGRALDFLVNGASQGQTSATGSIALTDGEMFIGGNGTGRHYFQGDVAEVIVFHRALDEAQHHRVGAYLKNRYGITAPNYDGPDPPNDRFQPTDIPGCVLWLQGEHSTNRANATPRLKQCFDFDWRFVKADPEDAQRTEFDDSQWRELDLPHDFSVEGPVDNNNPTGMRGGFFPLGVGWYRKGFTLPESYRGKRVILRFDGVMYYADVYVNGRHLGREANPYLSRDWDITDYLNETGTNVVAVRADTPRQMERWYTGAGIYRHVWLMAVEPVRVREFGTYITTPKIEREKATVHIKTTLLNQTGGNATGKLETIFFDPAGQEAARVETAVALGVNGPTQVEQRLTVHAPKLWSIETPNLYRAVSRLWNDERLTDEYPSTFGIRTIAFDANNGFSLNGRRVVMRGACLHQDIGALGAAVPDRAIERRLESLRAMGVNAIRTSHNPYSIEFLDLCDRMGFVVIDEGFDKWPEFRPDGTGWRESLLRFLDRDCNHPSIVLWSVGNEVGQQLQPEGVAIVKAMVQTVHDREPTRPVTCAMRPNRHADGRFSEMIHHIDVVALNYQSQLFEMLHETYPEMVLLGGETTPYYSLMPNWRTMGGDPNSRWLPVNPWFQVKQNVCGQFLWTGCDYLGEAVVGWPNIGWCCSPIDTCGRQKDYSYFIQSVYSDRPMARIVVRDPKAPVLGKYGWHWPPVRSHWNWDGYDGPLEVFTFTNAASVELLLGGKSLGTKRLADFADRMIRWEVPNEPGTIQAIARDEQGTVVARHELRTAGPPAQLEVMSDREVLAADGQGLAHVTVRVVDPSGNLVPHGEHAIEFTLEGDGQIVGVDNGNLYSHESFKAAQRDTYQGRALAIIRVGRGAGTIRLTARADGLESAAITIETKALPDTNR